MNRRAAFIPLIAALVVLAAGHLGATTVLQMNLGELCDRADRIYRGTVVEVTEGTIEVGGGELPTVTYKVRVDEAFKGSFTETKGVSVVEVRMIGNAKATPDQGGHRKLTSIPGMPTPRAGDDYVFFTTAPSAIGLSTFVGLGQGCFDLFLAGKEEQALNEVNNSGLIAGHPGGPILYSELVAAIHNELGN